MSGIDFDPLPDNASGPDQLRAGALHDIPWGGLALGGMALIAASLVAFIKITDDGVAAPRASYDMAGERRISVPDLPRSIRTEEATSTIARTIRPPALLADLGDGVQVVPRNVLVLSRDRRVGLAPAPDSRLSAPGPYGPLPRIGHDGARPADIYARPSAVAAAPGLPRIALVVTGLGRDAGLTARAIETLPGAVTLAYLSSGEAIAEQAGLGRAAGHEVLLQVPMDGTGDSQMAPRVLVAQMPRQSTLDALHWHMARFPGYIGLTQAQGARFMADPQALAPVLQEMADRGLVFLDASAEPGGLTLALAGATGAQAARADVVLETPQAGAIEASLWMLEEMARERGSALGVIGLDGASVDVIARFTQGLTARGFALVPASVLIRAPARTSARQAGQL
jgi:hypothetical protein